MVEEKNASQSRCADPYECPPFDEQIAELQAIIERSELTRQAAEEDVAAFEARRAGIESAKTELELILDAYETALNDLDVQDKELARYLKEESDCLAKRLGEKCIERIERLLSGKPSEGSPWEPPEEVRKLERAIADLEKEIGLSVGPNSKEYAAAKKRAHDDFVEKETKGFEAAVKESLCAGERLTALKTLRDRATKNQRRLRDLRTVISTAQAKGRWAVAYHGLLDFEREYEAYKSGAELVEPGVLRDRLLRAWCRAHRASDAVQATKRTLDDKSRVFNDKVQQLEAIYECLERKKQQVLERMDPEQNCAVHDMEDSNDGATGTNAR